MNETAGLLTKSAALLWRNPVIWLPLLVARAADFLIGFGLNLARGPVLRAVAPHSVMGGVVPRASAPVVVTAALFALLPILCELVLFVYSMVVCAKWTQNLRHTDTAAERNWRVEPRPLIRVAAITFAVSAVTIGVGTYFTLRGGVPVQWIPMVTGGFFVMSSWFLMPTWLRLIAREQGSRERKLSTFSSFIAFVIGVLGVVAVGYLGSNLQQSLVRSQKPHGAVVLFLLNFFFACLSSLPLAYSFVAMSLYAGGRSGWQAEWNEDAA